MSLIEFVVAIIVIAAVVGIIATVLRGTPGGSRKVALVSTLANLRKSIDAYRQEHTAFPGAMTAVPPKDACIDGSKGTGSGWPDEQGARSAFVEQLTRHSTARGGTCSVGGEPFVYGPYLRGGELPVNPVTGSNAIAIVGEGDLSMTSDADPPKGWKYDVLTGKLIADDPRYDDL